MFFAASFFCNNLPINLQEDGEMSEEETRKRMESLEKRLNVFQKKLSRLQAEYVASEQKMKERIFQLESNAGIQSGCSGTNTLSGKSQKSS